MSIFILSPRTHLSSWCHRCIQPYVSCSPIRGNGTPLNHRCFHSVRNNPIWHRSKQNNKGILNFVGKDNISNTRLLILKTNNFINHVQCSRLSRSNCFTRQTISQKQSKSGHLRNIFVRFCSSKSIKKNNEKSKRLSRSEARRLLSLAHPERYKLAGAICLLVISSTVTISIPYFIGRVINTIYTGEDGKMKERLQNICKVLIVVFLVGAAANFGRVYLMQISGNNVVKRLRERLFSSVMKQEIGFFDKTKTGELVNRLSTDTSLVGNSVTMNISDGLRSLAQAAGGVGMMIYVSPKLAAITMGIVPPVAIMSIIYGRYLRRLTKNIQDSLASATEVAEERISNIRTVRSFAQETKEVTAYNDRISQVLKLSYKEALARSFFWGATGLSGNIIVLSVLYSGGLMMTDAQITVGDLSAFLLYAAYTGVSIGGMTSFYTELMKGLGASTRLWELVDRIPTVPVTGGVIPSDHIVGNLEFKDIKFAYPSREDVSIFSGMNLTVPAGSVTAVVGASGSGKSTLAALLLRFYDPENGEIFLDGQNIKELDPVWLRSQVGTVSQEPVLFSCSVADNIAYGAADPSSVKMADIEDAARKANALHFIKSFPDGFDTLVGERGLMLSGGQRQRIAIARAILKNPKILLLDEATSALDAESEYLVQEALERVMVGRTVITIAHRLSTIKSADQIAALDKGKVAEIGSYSELMRLDDGIFKKLVERQTITQ